MEARAGKSLRWISGPFGALSLPYSCIKQTRREHFPAYRQAGRLL
jgi:hypothetical protein